MNYFFAFLFPLLLNQVKSIVFFTGCDVNCICDFRNTSLVIRCYMPFNRDFFLPNQFQLIQNITSITITDSFLANFPPNACQFSATLTHIDLSDNLISQNISKNLFDCLNNLEYLDLSNNSISHIEANSFDNLNKLSVLDLSFNSILSIDSNLFYFKLPSLFSLNLRRNRIEELDIWFLTMSSINRIDLSFNRIKTFINRKNWNPNLVLANFGSKNLELIDLRFNQLTSFNDDTLRLYFVCTQTEFNNFLNLFRKLLFTNNNLICNCQQSFNLLTYYQNFILSNTISNNDYLFFHECSSLSQFSGQNLFSFTNPDTCSANSNVLSCANSTNILAQENVINEPQKSLKETSLVNFNDSQIAGFVIGLVGFLFLFLLLIYFLCSIEILAMCFNCIPIFYRICPCKSGAKRIEEFDLFISYNRTNEKWVRENLIPFIKKRNLVQNYILHYNSANKYNEEFGSYTKNIMKRSSCILFVLSDAFLMNEWNNEEFREHLKAQVTIEKKRFIAIQLQDVMDEEVDEYFTEKFKVPKFVSLENDEYFFWEKLAYFLYTNNYIQKRKKSNQVHDFDEFSREHFSHHTYLDRLGPEFSSFSSSSSADSTTKNYPIVKKQPKKNYKKINTRTKPQFSTDRKPISKNNFKFHHEIIE